jgi:hypothetical protein
MASQTDDEFLDSLIEENKAFITDKSNNDINQRNNVIKDQSSKATVTSEKQLSAKEIIGIANKLWKAVKEKAKGDPGFAELSDKAKRSIFEEEFKEFMNEFPFITNYMVCAGQYSAVAFGRYLDKVRLTVHPPPEKREKGYMEDQYNRRNADYARYVWEASKKGKYDNSEAKFVWQRAYNTLKGEFDDFRNKYKELEKSTKEEKKANDAKNAKDLLERLATGKQNLEETDNAALLELLKDRLYKRRFSNALETMLEKTKRIEPVCEQFGMGEETPEENKQTIKMIEYVDNERINEVPKNLLARQEDLAPFNV